MNILILGTSNSILKDGYVDGLISELAADYNIVNLSIGASPGLQFGAFLNKNLKDFKYIIFDSLPNDEQYSYDTHGYDERLGTGRVLFEILSTISNKSNLIIMGFCLKHYLYNKTNVYEMRRKMAYAVNAHFIDIAEMLKYYNIADPVLSNIYEDHPAHPKASISYGIGKIIGKKIKTNSFKNRSGKSIDYSKNFYVKRISDFSDKYKTVHCSNSLTSDNFSEIPSGEIIKFNPANIVGFYVNSSATNCRVSLKYKEKCIFSMFLNFPLKRKFLKLFIPTPTIAMVDSIVIENLDQLKKEDIKPRMTLEAKSNTIIDKINNKINNLYIQKIQISEILFWNANQEKVLEEKNIISDYEAEKVSRDILFDISRDIFNNVNNSILKKIYVKTIYDTYLKYDTKLKICVHEKDTSQNNTSSPVFCQFINNKVLFYIINDQNHFITLLPSSFGFTEEPNYQNSYAEFIFSKNGQNGYSFQYKGFYMCAEPDGKIVCNRVNAKNWERFYIKFI